jgi:hypothetical protein
MSTSLRSILQGCRRFTMGLIVLGFAACADSSKDTEQIAAPASPGNPSANLDQCSNGDIAAPIDCVWVNGNLNSNNSHYFEGDSVAYRMRFDNLLTDGSNYDVIIEWDSSVGNAQNGHHALDYITSFDHSEATANPCLGVASCNPSTHSTFAMPLDPRVLAGPDDLPGTADDITQIPGVFTLYGGTITAVSDYGFRGDFSDGSKTSVTVSFRATVNNPVLAWGGHIGTRADWAPELTAVHIPGSPYHTMLVSLNGSGGAQDRSLSAAAVYALPELTVIKHVINDNGRTAVASDFTLNVTATNPDPATFPGAESPGTKVYLDPGTYAVTEGAHEGYEVTYSAGCTGTLDYDETATCTVTNDDINRCFGVTCPPPSSECLQEGLCNEDTGECEYAPKPADTSCTDDGEVCTDDVCNDVGECIHPAGHVGTLCREANGICDVPETCDGISPTCPADGFASEDLLCRGAAGECDAPEYCTGTSALCPDDAKLLTMCRAEAGFCDNAEYCDGVHDLCPPDIFANGERLCRDSAGICDVPEFCSGQSPDCPADVFQPDLVECRSRAGLCDLPEFCTGVGPLCPNDSFVPPTVTCRESEGVCDPAENCTGESALCPPDILDRGRLCRDSEGVCDIPEYCDGANPDCPENGFIPVDETCRPSAGICDSPERCTGVGPDCPLDGFLNGTECRASEGICDTPEVCDGLGPACPDDVFVPETEVCRDSAGICDTPEYCTGNDPLCPGDVFVYGVECRASEGICDNPEFCTGASANCPDDAFVPATEVCRSRAGICDIPEYCTGNDADCPLDAFDYGTECRASEGICDIPEFCNGAAADCPDDSFVPQTEVCRGSEGICDTPEYCTGNDADCPGDVFIPETEVCRTSAGICDIPEYCTGRDPLCPGDVFVYGLECRASEGICDNPEFCTGASANCPDDAFMPDDEVCRPGAGICDIPEYCTGDSASCPLDAFEYGTECRTADGICDIPEFCTGAAAECPDDSFVPQTEVCRERAGICDLPEYCTGVDADCPGDVYEYGLECRAADGICDIPEFCDGAEPDCPNDAFMPATEVCRETAGVCDRPEYCTGLTAECPDDALAPGGTICRESTGECDPEEACTGFDISCPDNIDDICTACGAKFYDLDLDRNRDEEEALIEGWEITISNASVWMTTFTDEYGAWSFESLPAGDYVICESVPLEDNWLQTSPPEDCYELTIPSEEAEQCTLDFGNVCLGAGGARSAGFWSNKNGEMAFLDDDRGASALAMLVSLNLVDGNGEAFDPANYLAFKTWIVKRTARNAAYQLSGQFAAAALNVFKLGVDPDRMVWVPGAIGSDDLGFIAVIDLLEEVNAELALHPYTPTGSLYRAYQEGLTEGLDDLNNNRNFLQFEPCDFSFPVLELKHR